jgi:chromate transporter
MDDNRLLGLIMVFAPLSLLSFGGGQAIVADIQNQTVHVHGWLSNQEFTDMFAISRAAPGPSTLIAALIGWQVHGFLGAVIAALAIYIPSSVLVYIATNWWQRNAGSPWRAAIERGLLPVAVGLIFAGALAVARAAHTELIGFATIGIATAVLYFTRSSPYVLIALVAVLYAGLQMAGLPYT